MILKDTTRKEYNKIKEEYVNYIPHYHKFLITKNGLETNRLYLRLSAYPSYENGYYYIVLYRTSDNECKLGFTASPVSYWINLIKQHNNDVSAIADIVIHDKGFDKKSASLYCRLYQNYAHSYYRKYRIKDFLE